MISETGGKDHNFGHGKSSLQIRKQFFAITVGKHWHTLSRDTVKLPPLATFKSDQNKVLNNLI